MSESEGQLTVLHAIHAEMVKALAILDEHEEFLVAAQLSLAVEALGARLSDLSDKSAR